MAEEHHLLEAFVRQRCILWSEYLACNAPHELMRPGWPDIVKLRLLELIVVVRLDDPGVPVVTGSSASRKSKRSPPGAGAWSMRRRLVHGYGASRYASVNFRWNIISGLL